MIKFGPSGNGKIFYEEGHKHTIEAPKWCKEHGLDCYEYSFGRGFTIKPENAKLIGDEAIKNDVLISVHAPYYISLGNENLETYDKNFNYIAKSLDYLKLFGGKKCVVHPGSCGKQPREKAFETSKKQMDYILEKYYQNNYDGLFICPETMGKSMQLGSVSEIIELCKMDKCLIPTFDFGHINCFTQGSLKTEQDYRNILEFALAELGEYKTKNLHIHFSKIEYTSKGEVKHLTLEDKVYGPEFEPLAKVIKDMKLEPTIISESKEIMMEDAMKLKKIYENIK